MAKDKPNYSKPASELDLEARQAEDYVPPTVVVKGTDAPLSSNGYIGVDPIYQNAANDTEKPIKAEGGAEAALYEKSLADDAEYPELDGEPVEDDDSSSSSGSTPTTPSTPPSSPPPGN